MKRITCLALLFGLAFTAGMASTPKEKEYECLTDSDCQRLCELTGGQDCSEFYVEPGHG